MKEYSQVFLASFLFFENGPLRKYLVYYIKLEEFEID